MKRLPGVAVAAALVVAGCVDLFVSKETRQRIEAIKAAVSATALVDEPDEDGEPPLHRAVLDDYRSLQGWLLDHGANPNARNKRGETTLHVAVFRDVARGGGTIRALIRRGADPNARREDGLSPLHIAAGYGREASLRALLDGGADPHVRSQSAETPLHLAATPQPDRTPEDCRLFVQELVARGADPDARNGFGIAPLHKAAMAGHVAVVGALLDASANIDLEGPEGVTALSLAAVMGHAPVVAELGARGADAGHRDQAGRTALEAALERPAIQYRDGGSGPVNVDAVVALLRSHGPSARTTR